MNELIRWCRGEKWVRNWVVEGTIGRLGARENESESSGHREAGLGLK